MASPKKNKKKKNEATRGCQFLLWRRPRVKSRLAISVFFFCFFLLVFDFFFFFSYNVNKKNYESISTIMTGSNLESLAFRKQFGKWLFSDQIPTYR